MELEKSGALLESGTYEGKDLVKWCLTTHVIVVVLLLVIYSMVFLVGCGILHLWHFSAWVRRCWMNAETGSSRLPVHKSTSTHPSFSFMETEVPSLMKQLKAVWCKFWMKSPAHTSKQCLLRVGSLWAQPLSLDCRGSIFSCLIKLNTHSLSSLSCGQTGLRLGFFSLENTDRIHRLATPHSQEASAITQITQLSLSHLTSVSAVLPTPLKKITALNCRRTI